MLVFIGLGYSTRHLTEEAKIEIKSADVIYIDTYTSLYEDPFDKVISLNPSAKYVLAKRRDLEGRSIQSIVEEARKKKVVIAIPGDPFIATTHDAIWSEALKHGIEVKVVNGISISTMIQSRLGLQFYRFGKPVTLVYPDHSKPMSVIEVIYDNLSRNQHTLVLLDLRLDEPIPRAMNIREAVELLIELDEEKIVEKQIAIGAARLGWRDEKICADVLVNLGKYLFPPPPHSLVVVARPNPVEVEFIEYWRKMC